jgi:hypothetical protein
LRPRWWAHALFGDASGRPPPGLSRTAAKRMKSLDEDPAAARRVTEAYGDA